MKAADDPSKTPRYPHAAIEASLDRWSESHWHIHQMEAHYHTPDPFRFSVNAFIRSLKEIPQILRMELQNKKDYHSTLKPIIGELNSNSLFSLLSKKRDFVVHQGMLQLKSHGQIGTTEGKGFKIGAPYPVHPHESSDGAYLRFVEVCRRDPDVRQLLGPDCDSLPCVERTWRISEFSDSDLLDVAVEAWRVAGRVLSQIVVHHGGQQLDLSMQCRHEPQKVRMKVYSRDQFMKYMGEVP